MSVMKPIAIVGLGAILPDAPDVAAFWSNIRNGHYSIREVPANRWRTDLYYNPDPSVPDKTYSKIGGWVDHFDFQPIQWGIPIPPNVLAVMDEGQKWAIAASRQALMDYGYPKQRSLDPERVAVIFGNALAGEQHYQTSFRIHLPEVLDALATTDAFQELPQVLQQALLQGVTRKIQAQIPAITEDTMPGELSNIIAGRVANVFNFGGANFVTDAACASSMAALQAAVDGLNNHQFDAVLTGGIDRNMGVEGFVKFSKIGALSPDGSRPYADGANGFVMGEGAVVFLLKRLEDAEKNGDPIYAVIRGIGSSSDGKGKGITAPNPIGQQRAVERAWKNAGLSPANVGLIEGHGTSTRVGDVVELNSLTSIFGEFGLKTGQVALGSVKSNIGHLKSAAGAAGLLKVVLSLKDQILPPSVNFHRPNPNIEFSKIPFYVNTATQPWEQPGRELKRAGVSSFGFGGTNFHVVLEEYVPEMLKASHPIYTGVEMKAAVTQPAQMIRPVIAKEVKPYRGLLFLGANTKTELQSKLAQVLEAAKNGQTPACRLPLAAEVQRVPERLAIDYSDAEDLVKRGEKALKGFENDTPNSWQALTAQGVYRGSGNPGKIAFLFPGQGSQYVNMLKDLGETEPVIRETFEEADRVMTPLLGRPLTSYIYVDGDEESLKRAEAALRDTTITQPAVLTTNVALLRLMKKYGFSPDMVIGHSLGEYAALVAAGVLTFAEALEVVSARGREMAKVSMEDNGCMAAVSGPLAEVERILKTIDGYVVIANINSPVQSVIGGATNAVEAAIAAFQAANIQAVKIPVSHAFHTQIVAPASQPLRNVIERMNVQTPQMLIAANVTGQPYPSAREDILDILSRQVASPVQFIQGIETLYQNGARVFVEVGPKRVLNALATDILKDREGVTLLATNHPRKGAVVSFNEALCGLFAAGVAADFGGKPVEKPVEVNSIDMPTQSPAPVPAAVQDGRLPITGSVVISGAGLGLPGRSGAVFSDDNVQRILRGESFIEPMPELVRKHMLEKRVTRLIKSEAGAQMVEIQDMDLTIKLAGQRGGFDLSEDFGVSEERVESTDITTQLAIAAGVEALRDAGIPLVMNYRQTSVGSYLPNRWMLPESLADETGIIFASAFPGLDRMAEEEERYHTYQRLTAQKQELVELLTMIPNEQELIRTAIAKRLQALDEEIAQSDYHFDRRFIFRILAMGHSQFAEYIGARGPNTYVNAACATTTHAVGLAEDWIRAGRCRRVVIIAGDDVTGGSLVNWIGTGLLASGATTTEGNLRKAALPFDRRRNGMIMGMGAAALVVESEDAARERGVRAICEVLATQIANSAFHGTRLDVQHVSDVMDRLVTQAEQRFGLRRDEIAPQCMFVSHETYTPARGGSAAAEICALRRTFGEKANQVVIANTKGFTGHTMGVGVEDVVAVKALEYGIVPPIAHFDEGFEPDPDLGDLNLSKGGKYPVRYALRLGAGFGSQIAMSFVRRIPGEGERVKPEIYQRWLAAVAGYEQADLEVVKRTLRVANQGQPVRQPAKSTWQFGQGPTLWADADDPVSAAVPQLIQPVVKVDSQPVKAATAPVAPSPVTASAVDSGEICAFVLALVSEKTGYPQEMLDLDLDLEADLGVDTVKQAELFAAVREHYGIARREDLRLVDYNTLNKVIQFVLESKSAAEPGLTVAAEVVSVQTVSTGAAINRDEIQAYVVQQVSEKTGYPAEMLDLELDLEADLGVDTVKQAELFATVREHYSIPRREDLRLVEYNTLNKVIQFIVDSLSSSSGSVITTVDANASTPVKDASNIASAVARNEIKSYVLQQVSEKTGYPQDMLDLDLDLEADLGVDTVKQAELFATIRENYGIPRREDLRLVEYNTLNKVIQFIVDSLEAVNVPAETQIAAAQTSEAGFSSEGEPSNGIDEEIKAFVLAQVSEKTGYPQEMLDLDLDLEADLGVDTVKQAELFATIREHYKIPRREDLRLVDYNTLAKVIQFMHDSLRAKAVEAEKTALSSPVEPEQLDEMLQEKEEAGAKIIRRVPVPVLRPRLDLCMPTGVNIDGNSRIVIVADQGKTADSLARRMRSRKAQVLVIQANAAGLEKLQAWQHEGPIQGVYFLPALTVEPLLSEMNLDQWQAGLETRAMFLYHLLRAIPGEPFLICATRMGGIHGYTPEGASAPMGGAVSGFAKAIAWERPESLVKVVDFQPSLSESEIASRLLEETLRDPAVVELGWEGDQRFTILAEEQPISMQTELNLGERPVFLISGGSGGITAPVVKDLAAQAKGVFYLLSRTVLPERDLPALKLLKTNKEELRKHLYQELTTRGEKATPAQIEKRIESLERAAATLELLDAIEQLGGRAVYLPCDITQAGAVEQVIANILKTEGRVDVLVHAAGMERSRKLESKPFEEFASTIAVKADGFFKLYKALEQHSALPKAIVAFTSVAGRFGNAGQTDYSAANDLICKLVSALRNQQPGIKAMALDWGAWAEVGMASRGHIPALMKRAGIDMMHPADAAPMVYRELVSGCVGGESVFAGSLGLLMQPRRPGTEIDVDAANKALTEGEPIHIMLSRMSGLDLYQGILLEAELNPNEEPFLKDHALNGIPLLPGVMGIEGFSIAAQHVASSLGSHQGSFRVVKLEQVQFLAPFKFYRNEPRRITWKAQVVREQSGLVARVALESKRVVHTREDEIIQHFAGRVVLEPTRQKAETATVTPPHWNGAYTVHAEDIYKLYFHGPAFQVLEGVQRSGDQVLGKLQKNLPPFTAERQNMVTTPILVELCLQTAGVWEIGITGAMSLPRSIGSLRLYPIQPNGLPIYAEVHPHQDESGSTCFDARVVDAKGNLFLEMTDYRTVALPYSVEEGLIQPLRALVQQGQNPTEA